MKLIIYLSATMALFVTCNIRQKDRIKEAALTDDIYTCSMHPQIQEHQPGDCPICGMKLIKKTTKPGALDRILLESLLKPANEFVIASITVVTPQRKKTNMPLTAYGTIEYDTRAAGTVSARVSGRIEKMYVRYRYQPVERGQKIMDIYSPEMLTAEQDLLFLLHNDAGNTSFIGAAKDKLLLLGMSQAQLDLVIQTAKPLYSISIYSKYSGHVHDAGMVHETTQAAGMGAPGQTTQELSLKEGMYVQKGQTLLMIMDHHMVWAALQVFPTDQSLIQVGNAVSIVPETDTTVRIFGKIDFIEPFFREGSKSMTTRVYFHNEHMLPIGSQVIANIKTNAKDGLWLPRSAVVSLGMKSVVFVKQVDGFLAHEITTGLKSGKNIQILSGVNEIDTVAANGQYLMDSESFISTSSKK
ncbi:MAG TPA: efflux RND transporter periplasmic adaptor subunit [Puia sp.]|nr:efflux RND transporter periplasmic adaptor subunit [Puia sp.]